MPAAVSEGLFFVSILLYLGAAAAYFVHFYLRQWGGVATWLAVLAWATHAGTLIAAVVAVHHPPLQTVHEALVFLAWVIVFNYLMLEYFFRLKAAGAFLIPVVAAMLIYAGALPRAAGPEAVPGNLWILLHAVIALAGYGAFTLAFAVGLMYLIQERQLRAKAFRLLYHRLPSLETLDQLAFRLVVGGFPLLVLAVLTGSFWARRTWGVPWFLEPKGLWSLVTLAIYAAYIGARIHLGWRGRKAAWLAVAGFGAVLFNLLVVNLFLSQKHGF